MTTLTFPEDFVKVTHLLGGVQWLDNRESTNFSIVGGAKGSYGDGIRTFEMWDYREEGPRGYLTTEQINKHLKDNPIL